MEKWGHPSRLSRPGWNMEKPGMVMHRKGSDATHFGAIMVMHHKTSFRLCFAEPLSSALGWFGPGFHPI
jgi:hypothetical protein